MKPEAEPVKLNIRLALKIMGFVLIVAGLATVGYAIYDIIEMNTAGQDSLLEAEQLLGDMDAYTGAPDVTFAPGGTLNPSDIGDMPDIDTGETEPPQGSGQGGASKPAKVLGMLVFESLGGRKVPVLEGVTAADLKRGAAHHSRTSPPGGVGNCVIFGHRDTVFRGFGSLKEGDTIRLEVPGEEEGTKTVYKYKIISMAVVEPGDPRIFKAYGDKVMTLVTCYPFRYVGAAPKRYIVVTQLQ
jgi:sortase A